MTATNRSGFSLMEVLLATAILLGSVIVLGELAGIGRQNANSAEELATAQRLCQNKLNEILAGLTSLEPVEAETLATAIRIGRPVSWKKSLRGLHVSGGVVEKVSDQEILDAKAHVDAAGIGAEPASCATVAGARKLVAAGVIGRKQNVCGILTGHLLKDPDVVVGYHREGLKGIDSNFANRPVRVSADLESILAEVRRN